MIERRLGERRVDGYEWAPTGMDQCSWIERGGKRRKSVQDHRRMHLETVSHLNFHPPTRAGLLTPYGQVLSALHGDDEGNQKDMVIGRGFDVTRPQIAKF